jgi:hypothetical protein
MKIKQSQILTGLALSFGLLSLFSIWNIYNWDLLGWGTKLFLFPFLAAISFLTKLTPEQTPLYVRIQLGLLGLHTLFYLIVFELANLPLARLYYSVNYFSLFLTFILLI